jgi:hypothetical protein
MCPPPLNLRFCWLVISETLQRNLGTHIVLLDGINQLFFKKVEVVDVCLMMLGVVDLHNFSRDVRLEGIVIVRKIGQGMLLAGDCTDRTENRAAGCCDGSNHWAEKWN